MRSSRSFDPPQEPEWHRMIAEAAYYLAEKRGFAGEHALDDWLTAERQVGQLIRMSSDDLPVRLEAGHGHVLNDGEAPSQQ
jgi:hypothetical protein